MGDDMGLIENYEEAWTIDYDDLEFGETLGEGAFGAVYRGMYLGAEVAIKRLFNDDDSPDAELFIHREINVLKGMRHPNIVQFIGIARHPEKGLHIVTELVKAGDLRKLIKNPSIKLSWSDRVKIAYSAACAMAYLHSRNIIHRDLKSKNLLVEDAGNSSAAAGTVNWRVKICDFGFARTTSGKAARPMTLCGTDDWMAPEIILGDAYSVAADVFSYGIVLCEIITRKKVSADLQRSPIDAFGLNVERFKKIIPVDCPSDFSLLAIDCCAHSPDDRPTFAVVVRRLKTIMKDVTDKEKAKPIATTTAASGENVERFKAYADKLANMKAAGKLTTVSPANNSSTPQMTVASKPPLSTNMGNHMPIAAPQKTITNQTATAPITGAGRGVVQSNPSVNVVASGNNTIRKAGNPNPNFSNASSNATTTDVNQVSSQGGGPYYTYEQLRSKDAPAGLDRNNMERYLNDAEFQKVFNMPRSEFAKLPAWKQRGRKRELNLF